MGFVFGTIIFEPIKKFISNFFDDEDKNIPIDFVRLGYTNIPTVHEYVMREYARNKFQIIDV